MRPSFRHPQALEPPAAAFAAAENCWISHTIDAELLQLTHDSAVDQAAVAVRGTTDTRLLSLSGARIEIEVEISGEREIHLLGQIVPAQSV